MRLIIAIAAAFGVMFSLAGLYTQVLAREFIAGKAALPAGAE